MKRGDQELRQGLAVRRAGRVQTLVQRREVDLRVAVQGMRGREQKEQEAEGGQHRRCGDTPPP